MDAKSSAVLKENAPALTWNRTLELSYESAQKLVGSSTTTPQCFSCQTKLEDKVLRCAKCQVATYCSRECQVKDWKSGSHKAGCSSYKRVGSSMNFDSTGDDGKAEARRDIFQRIRFYACAYAVHQASILGKGFLFVQSDKTLAQMSLAIPKDTQGRPLPNRSVLLHYLTQGEFESEVCREDFEMATVGATLKELVTNYDEQTEMVLLMRFRCGHVALGVATLVPDYSVCKQLGVQYFGDNPPPSLQLNIDDA